MIDEFIWFKGTDWNSKLQIHLCIDYIYSSVKCKLLLNVLYEIII